MMESIILFSFHIFYEFVRNFYKFFKCRLSNKNSRKSAESRCEWGEIIETNIWIRMIRVNFYFLNLFLNNKLVFFKILFTIFCSRYLVILKNRFWKRTHPNSWFWTSTLRSNSVNIRRRNALYVSNES